MLPRSRRPLNHARITPTLVLRQSQVKRITVPIAGTLNAGLAASAASPSAAANEAATLRTTKFVAAVAGATACVGLCVHATQAHRGEKTAKGEGATMAAVRAAMAEKPDAENK
ncbi:hypothetical protein F5144DRAFT_607266 [Chaetomium tenue]|uniref:Uncharacterized protein n=1 Tax=Chaetomium tenue TaxID=1854479 RepID=A0ACB7NVL6_9PEZI|nr:hypothetical protein F5144DRAFT_607266 [Chaetomium globosum]